jgi:hypothetical protein
MISAQWHTEGNVQAIAEVQSDATFFFFFFVKLSPDVLRQGKYISASNCIDIFAVNFFDVKVTK